MPQFEVVGALGRTVVESLAEEGMTLLMVTHEMNFARKVSDRVIFMHQGRVHEMGTPQQMFGEPQTPELRQFLSSLNDQPPKPLGRRDSADRGSVGSRRLRGQVERRHHLVERNLGLFIK